MNAGFTSSSSSEDRVRSIAILFVELLSLEEDLLKAAGLKSCLGADSVGFDLKRKFRGVNPLKIEKSGGPAYLTAIATGAARASFVPSNGKVGLGNSCS